MEEYVGQILERAIRRQSISISELSRRMNISRRTLYNWFNKRTLDKKLVCSIGAIIGYDFSKELGPDFNDDIHWLNNRRHLQPKLGKTLPENRKEMDYWSIFQMCKPPMIMAR